MIDSTVLQIVADTLDLAASDVRLTSTLAELKADSLTIIEVVLAVEDRFKIEISDDQWTLETTVGAMLADIKKLVTAKAA